MYIMYAIDAGKFWVYQRINEGSFTFQLDSKEWISRGEAQITVRVNKGKRIEIETRVSIGRVRCEGSEFHSVIGLVLFCQFLQLWVTISTHFSIFRKFCRSEILATAKEKKTSESIVSWLLKILTVILWPHSRPVRLTQLSIPTCKKPTYGINRVVPQYFENICVCNIPIYTNTVEVSLRPSSTSNRKKHFCQLSLAIAVK